jgi:hypothetical protein
LIKVIKVLRIAKFSRALALVLLFALGVVGCSGDGANDLANQSLGLSLKIIGGNEQVSIVSQLYSEPLQVQIVNQAQLAVPSLEIEFVQLSDTDALIINPRVRVDSSGQASTTVRAPSLYGRTINIQARIVGTSVMQEFTLRTPLAGGIRAIGLDTQNNSIEEAGLPFYINVYALDEVGSIVDDYGTPQNPVTHNVAWTFITNASWGRQAPTLEDISVCHFVNGVCQTQPNFILTDAERPTTVSAELIGEPVIPAFQHPIEVVRGPAQTLGMTNQPGGPSYVFNESLFEWQNIGALFCNNIDCSSRTNFINVDIDDLEFFAVILDRAGNYVRNTQADDNVVWSIVDPETLTELPISNELSTGSTSESIVYDPRTAVFPPDRVTLRADVSSIESPTYTLTQFHVDPGHPAQIEMNENQPLVFNAGVWQYVPFRLLDQHGNLCRKTTTSNGVTGTVSISIVISGARTGPIVSGGPPRIQTGSLSNTGYSTNSFTGNYYLENGLPVEPVSFHFSDATDVAPVITFTMSRPDDPFNPEVDESFDVITTIDQITVAHGQAARLEVRYDNGNPLTDPLICGIEDGSAGGWTGVSSSSGANRCSTNFVSGQGPVTFYSSIADAGGNALQWNGSAWEPTPDYAPQPMTINEWRLSQPLIQDMGTRFNTSHMTFTPSIEGNSNLVVQTQAQDGENYGTTFREFRVAPSELDHYTVNLVSNHPLSGSVFATQTFNIELTMRDLAGNRLFQNVTKDLTPTHTPELLAPSPNGEVNPFIPSGPIEFINGVGVIANVRIPNSNENPLFTINYTDAQGIESQTIGLTVVPGPLAELRIRNHPNGLMGQNLNGQNIEINTENEITYHLHAYDALGNLRGNSNLLASWQLLGGMNTLVSVSSDLDGENRILFEPNRNGTGSISASFGGFTASTGTITIHPGNYERLEIERISGGSNIRAGEQAQISVRMVDSKGNTLVSQLGDPANEIGNGPKDLDITITNNSNTRLGHNHTATPSGVYEFVNGELVTPHTFTFFNSANNPRIRYEFNNRVSSYPLSGFNVRNDDPYRIFIQRSQSEMLAGNQSRFDVYLEDIWGNVVTTGPEQSSLINIQFQSTLNNQEFTSANGLADPVGIGTDILSANLVQGAGHFNITATQSGTLQLMAQIPDQTYVLQTQSLTVLPRPTVTHVNFVSGHFPPTSHPASLGTNSFMQFRVQVEDEYNNVIHTNSSDPISLSVIATDDDPAALGGNTNVNLVNGVANFINTTYPRAHEITLRATHSPSDLFVEQTINIVPNVPVQSLTLLPGEELRQGVTNYGDAVIGVAEEQVVGESFTVRIKAIDEAFNQVVTYEGPTRTASINLSNDPNGVISPAGFTSFVGGEIEFEVNHRRSGEQRVFVTSTLFSDNSSGVYLVNTGIPSYLVGVMPGQQLEQGVLSFGAALISAPIQQTVGIEFDVAVHLTDQFYNIIDDNTSVVNISFPTDSSASHIDGTGLTLTQGSAFFQTTFLRAHSNAVVNLELVDGPSLSTIYNTSQFEVSSQANPTFTLAYVPAYQSFSPGKANIEDAIIGEVPDILAGQNLSVRVLAVDIYGNIVKSYNEPASLQISDSRANPPDPGQFVNGDITFTGVHYIIAQTGQSFVAQTALTDRPSNSFDILTNNVRQTLPVLAGQVYDPGHYNRSDALTGSPTSPIAGEPGFYVDIYLVDEYFNQVNENPSVSVITDDPTDTDPGAQNLVSGLGRFDILNFRAGERTLVASSPHSDLISDSYELIHNTPIQAAILLPGQTINGGFTQRHQAVSGTPSNQRAGVNFTAQVLALDAYFNRAFSYNGPIAISTDDPNDEDPVAPTQFVDGLAVFNIFNTTQGSERFISIINSSFSTNFNSDEYILLPNNTLPRKVITLLPGETITQGIETYEEAINGSMSAVNANQQFTVTVMLTDHYHNILSNQSGNAIDLVCESDPHSIISPVGSGNISNGQAQFYVQNRRSGSHQLDASTASFSTTSSSNYSVLALEPVNLITLMPGTSLDHGASSFVAALQGSAEPQMVSNFTNDNSFNVEVVVTDKFFNRAVGNYSVALTTPGDPFDDESNYILNSFDNTVAGTNLIPIDHRRALSNHTIVPTLTGGVFSGNCFDGFGECSGPITTPTYLVAPERATKTLVLLNGETLANPGAPDPDSAIDRVINPAYNTDNDITVSVLAVDDYHNINTNVGNSTSVAIQIISDDNSPSVNGQFTNGQVDLNLIPVTPTTGHTINVTSASNDEGGPWTHIESTPFSIEIGSPHFIISQLPGQNFNQSRLEKGMALTGSPNSQQAGVSFDVSVYLTDKRYNIVPMDQDITVSSFNDDFANFSSLITLSNGQISNFNYENRLAHESQLKHINFTPSGGVIDGVNFPSDSYLVNPGPGARLVALVADQQTLQPGYDNINDAVNLIDPEADFVTTISGSAGFNAQVLYTDNYFNVLSSFNASNTVGLTLPAQAATGPTGTYDLVDGSTSSMPNITHISAGTFTATPTWPVDPPAGLTVHAIDYLVLPAPASQTLVLFDDQTLNTGVATLAEAVSNTTATKVAGSEHQIRVYALDPYFNIVTTENGSFTLSSTDHIQGLQGDLTLNFESGVKTLPNKVRPVRATTGTPWQVQALISGLDPASAHPTPYEVSPGDATQLLVRAQGQSFNPGQTDIADAITGTPTTQMAGTSANVSVYHTDDYFNLVTTSNVPVTLSAVDGALGAFQDPLAVLTGTPPTNLTSGQATFDIDLRSVGARRVLASADSLSTQSADINVTHGDPAQMIVLFPGQTHQQSVNTLGEAIAGPEFSHTAGSGATIIARLVDTWFNTIQDLGAGTSVTLTSTEADYDLTPGDGTTTLSATGDAQAVMTLTSRRKGDTWVVAPASISLTGITLHPSLPYEVTPDSASLQLLTVLQGQTFTDGIGKASTPDLATVAQAYDVSVYAVDQFMNQTDDSITQVTLTLEDSFAPAISPQTLTNGVAQFTIEHRIAQTDYRVQATNDSSYPTSQSDLYTVNPGPGARLVALVADQQTLQPGYDNINDAVNLIDPEADFVTTISGSAGFNAQVLYTDNYFNVLSSFNASNTVGLTLPAQAATGPTGTYDLVDGSTSSMPNITHISAGTFTATPTWPVDPPAGLTVHAIDYLVLPAPASQTLVLFDDQTLNTGVATLAEAVSNTTATKVAGSEHQIRVYALDPYFNIVTTENGSFTLSSTDHIQGLQGDLTLNFESGVKTLPNKVRPVRATTGTPWQVQALISGLDPASAHPTPYEVSPGDATQLLVRAQGQSFNPGQTDIADAITGTPTTQMAGTSANVSVYHTDDYFNLVTTSNVPVTLSAVDGALGAFQDPLAVLTGTPPTNLTSGQATFDIDLRSVGARRVLASADSLSTQSADINVTHGDPAQMIVLFPGQTHQQSVNTLGEAIAGPEFSHTAGSGATIIARLVDTWFNTIQDLGAGTSVTLTSTEADYDLTPGDGTTTLSATGDAQAVMTLTSRRKGDTWVVAPASISLTGITLHPSLPYEVTPDSASLQLLTVLQGQTFTDGIGKASTPDLATVAQAYDVSVYAVDQFMNQTDDSITQVTLTLEDSFAPAISPQTLTNGVAQFTIEHRIAQTDYRVQATNDSSYPTSQSDLYTVNPGPGARLVALVADQQTLQPGYDNINDAVNLIDPEADFVTTISGSAGFNAQVLYTDNYFNVLSSFNASNTVGLTLPAQAATGPTGTYDLVDGSTSSMPNITHISAGTFTATPTWPVDPPAGLTVHAIDYLVLPAPASQTLVLFDDQTLNTGVATLAEAVSNTTATKVAGSEHQIRVYALDPYFNIVTTENGSFTLSSTDHIQGLQGDLTLNFESGVKTLPNKVRPVRATTGTPWQVQALISGLDPASAHPTPYEVSPGDATQLLVRAQGQSFNPGQTDIADAITGTPTTQMAGTSANVSVYHTDDYFNLVTTSNVPVTLSAVDGALGAFQDPLAVLTGTPPTNLTSGQATFDIDLRSVGARRVLASADSLSTQSADINVTHGDPAQMIVLFPGQTHQQSVNTLGEAIAGPEFSHTAGSGATIIARLVDTWFNTIQDLGAGTSVTLTSTEADYDLTPGDGTTTLSATGDAQAVMTLTSRRKGDTWVVAPASISLTGITLHPSLPYEVTPDSASLQLLTVLQGQTFTDGIGKASTPDLATVAQAYDVSVYAVDQFMNQTDDSITQVTLTLEDSFAPAISPQTLTNGVAQFTIEHRIAQTDYRVQATNDSSYPTSQSDLYTVNPGPGARLVALVADQQTLQPGYDNINDAVNLIDPEADFVTTISGSAGFNAQVLYTDNYFNVLSSFNASNTVGLTLPAQAATGPTGTYDLVDGSTSSMPNITHISAGTFTATPTWPVDPPAGLTVHAIDYLVLPAPASQTLVLFDDQTLNTGVATLAEAVSNTTATKVAGSEHQIRVYALDPYFNIVTTENGSFTLSSTDHIQGLQGDLTLNFESGVKTLPNKVRPVRATTGTPWQVQALISGLDPASAHPTPYEVSPGDATQLLVRAQGQSFNPGQTDIADAITGTPTTQMAGTSANVSVYHTDDYFNLVTTSNVPVTLSAVDGALGAFQDPLAVLTGTPPTNLTSGQATFDIDLRSVGARRVLASADSLSTQSADINVTHGDPVQSIVILPGQTHVESRSLRTEAIIGTPNNPVAGSSFSIETIAVDAWFNRVYDYNESLTITSSDPNDEEPTTPTSFSSGSALFSITHVTANVNQTISAVTNLSADLVSDAYEIIAGEPHQLITLLPGQTHVPGKADINNAVIGSPERQTVGEDFPVIIKAVDQFFNLTSDTREVTVVTNDLNDIDPLPQNLVSGTQTFTINNKTAGSGHIITASATGLLSQNSSSYEVDAAEPASVIAILPGQTHNPGKALFNQAVTGVPSVQTAGTSFNVEVMAVDAYFNRIVTDDSSSVTLSISDPGVSAPAAQTLSEGYAQFNITPTTAGSEWYVIPSITGLTSISSDFYSVNAGIPSQLLVLLPGQTHINGVSSAEDAIAGIPTPQKAGSGFVVDLIVVDDFYNQVTHYNDSRYLRFTADNASPAPNDPDLNYEIPNDGIYSFVAGNLELSGNIFYNADDNPSLTIQECIDGSPCTSIGWEFITNSIVIEPANDVNYILVRDQANGAGSIVTTNTYSTADTDPIFYSAAYDLYGNYKEDVDVTWQASRTLPGDLDSHMTPLIGSPTTTLSLNGAGPGELTIKAIPSEGAQGETGIITIFEQGASSYTVELASAGDQTSGNPFSITITAKTPEDLTATDYSGVKTLSWSSTAINGNDICGASNLEPELPPTTLEFTNGVATTTVSTILKATQTGVTVTAQSNGGQLTGTTAPFDVTAGSLDCIEFRDDADGAGSIISDLILDIDTGVVVYAAGYDQYGNFLADQDVSWTGSGSVEHLPYPENGIATRVIAVRSGTGQLIANGSKSIELTMGSGITTWTSSSLDSENRARLGSNTVRDIFFWDVISDNHNAWRTESGSQSWKSEIASNDRGSRDNFPPRAHIISNISGIDIIDATSNDLFMRLNSANNYALDNNFGTPNKVVARNGKIFISLRDDLAEPPTGSLIILDLDNDEIYRTDSTGSYKWSGTIAQRNQAGTWSADTTYPTLSNHLINSLDIKTISGNDYLAIGNNLNAQVIKTNGSTTIYNSTEEGEVKHVLIDSNGSLYYAIDNIGIYRSDLSLPLSANFSSATIYDGASNAEVPALNYLSMNLTEASSTADAGKNTIFIGSHRGLTIINEHVTSASATSRTISYKGDGNRPFDGNVQFDGQTGYITAPHKVGVTNIATIEFWFRPDQNLDATSIDFVLFEKGDGSKITNGNFGIEFNGSTGAIELYAINDDTHYKVNSTITTWNKGQWHHLMAIIDGSNGLKLWIDGNYQAGNAVDLSGLTVNTGSMNWGARSGSSDFFYGSIDEFRLTTDVRQLGTADFTPPTAEFENDVDTLYLYHFNESSGETAGDSASDPLNATLAGASWFNQPTFFGYDNQVESIASINIDGKADLEISTVDAWSSLSDAGNFTEINETAYDQGLSNSTIRLFNKSTTNSYDLIFGNNSGVTLNRK